MLQNNELNWFEQKILTGLNEHNINLDSSDKFGVAVSGGADSVSLLVSMFFLQKKFNFSLYPITVNHFIREEKETCGDVEFVQDLCSQLNIPCVVCNLPKGAVLEYSQKNKCGIEAGARVLRYEQFEQFISQEKLDYLCLAHNKNDFLETMLARILQGSSIEGLHGIEYCREKFLRPLINISREEIEKYLNEKNISWRTDSTNSDTKYFRNRIRNKLVPLLNQEFEGWDSGITTTALKATEDFQIIQNRFLDFYSNKEWFSTNKKNIVEIQIDQLLKNEDGIIKRLILKGCNQVSKTQRISSAFLDEICFWLKSENKKENQQEFSGHKYYSDIDFEIKKSILIIKKQVKTLKEMYFSVIIEETGIYELPFTQFQIIKNSENGICIKLQDSEIVLNELKFPFCIRNFRPGDLIKTADNSYKKIADIFSDWQVPSEKRCEILLVQDLSAKEQPVTAILGNFTGYKNWIVK